MRIDNSTGKGTSGMDKFSSEVHRVHMELTGGLQGVYIEPVKPGSLAYRQIVLVKQVNQNQKIQTTFKANLKKYDAKM
jgi:predicted protein tyrosine phosphatase